MAAGLGDVSVGWKKGGAVEVVLRPFSFIASSSRRVAAAELCGHLQQGVAAPPRRLAVRRRRRRLGVLVCGGSDRVRSWGLRVLCASLQGPFVFSASCLDLCVICTVLSVL